MKVIYNHQHEKMKKQFRDATATLFFVGWKSNAFVFFR